MKKDKIKKISIDEFQELLNNRCWYWEYFNKKKLKELIEERKIARENKDWNKADELRDKIKELGFEVQDTKEGIKLYEDKILFKKISFDKKGKIKGWFKNKKGIGKKIEVGFSKYKNMFDFFISLNNIDRKRDYYFIVGGELNIKKEDIKFIKINENNLVIIHSDNSHTYFKEKK